MTVVLIVARLSCFLAASRHFYPEAKVRRFRRYFLVAHRSRQRRSRCALGGRSIAPWSPGCAPSASCRMPGFLDAVPEVCETGGRGQNFLADSVTPPQRPSPVLRRSPPALSAGDWSEDSGQGLIVLLSHARIDDCSARGRSSDTFFQRRGC